MSFRPILIAFAFVASGAAFAQYGGGDNVRYDYADVLRVDPVYEVVRYTEPQEDCYDQPVVYRERDRGNPAGAVLGAVIGGVLGSQVGSGDGRRAATVAGAVVGGAVGSNSGRREGREYEDVERRCRVVDVQREDRRVAGYEVEYQYKGDVFVSRMPYDPGSKLRVRVAVAPAD